MIVKQSLSSRPGCEILVKDQNGEYRFHKVKRVASRHEYETENPNEVVHTGFRDFFYEVEDTPSVESNKKILNTLK